MIEIIAIPNWNVEKKQSALHFSSINECARAFGVPAEYIYESFEKRIPN